MHQLPQAAPIVPWIGGKRRLADKLLPLFPEHKCYVELFCGGAALYFLRQIPAPSEILNDINGELTNLYRVVQNHLEEFVRQFKWALTSRQVFKWLQDTNPTTLTDIQRAARFFYLQRHAFGGMVDSQTFGVDTTGAAINLCRIEENLSAAHLRLAGTYIDTLPWLECFNRYDRPHTFFYADPPYWQSVGYGVPFEFAEYEALADAMRRCRGKIMVSINDHPDIRRCFEGFCIEELSIKYSLSNYEGPPKASQELVITNWDVHQSSGLF